MRPALKTPERGVPRVGGELRQLRETGFWELPHCGTGQERLYKSLRVERL